MAQGDTAKDISRDLRSLVWPVRQLMRQLRHVHKMLELVHDHFHLPLFVVTFAELAVMSTAFHGSDFAVLLDVQFQCLVRSACETSNSDALEPASVSRVVPENDFCF